MQKIRTIFIGTSDFGIPTLEYILKSEKFELVCVITQPDKTVGRKQELTASPIKQFVLANDFDLNKIEQPEKIKLVSQEILEKYNPELIVVASYGQIIPSEILDYPKYKCLNIHGSILPKLRGAVPVHMAILQNFKNTGVTIQRMVLEMDAGPIIAKKEIEIANHDTTETLLNKLAKLGADLFSQTIDDWINRKIKEIDQDHDSATYCFKTDIEKDKAEIKFETDIYLAERMIRAFYPWPVAWIRLKNGKILKIFNSHIKSGSNLKPIDILCLLKEGKELILNLQNGQIVLDEVQLEGKTRGSGVDYLYLSEK